MRQSQDSKGSAGWGVSKARLNEAGGKGLVASRNSFYRQGMKEAWLNSSSVPGKMFSVMRSKSCDEGD